MAIEPQRPVIQAVSSNGTKLEASDLIPALLCAAKKETAHKKFRVTPSALRSGCSACPRATASTDSLDVAHAISLSTCASHHMGCPRHVLYQNFKH